MLSGHTVPTSAVYTGNDASKHSHFQTLKNPTLLRHVCRIPHSKHTPQALNTRERHRARNMPPTRRPPRRPHSCQASRVANSFCMSHPSSPPRPSGAPPAAARRRRASPGQSQVSVRLLPAGGGRIFQSLQQRRQGATTRSRHVGHPEARTGKAENPVTEGNSQPHSGGPGRVRAQTRAPSRASQPRRVHNPRPPRANQGPKVLLRPTARPRPTPRSVPGPLPPPLSRAAFN